jgi:hypothetical protein
MSRLGAMYALQRCSQTARVCKTGSSSSARRPDHAGDPTPVYKRPPFAHLGTTQTDPPYGQEFIGNYGN